MSSVLNVSDDAGNKPEEFSLKDIEVVVDSEEQNWFKRAHVGKSLNLKHIDTLVTGLDKCEMLTRNDIKAVPMVREAGLGLRIIKTRRINPSRSLGLCIS